MKEQLIVGAGLSGLVAGINLTREGYKVTIKDRRPAVGGKLNIPGSEDEIINIGDGTPMNLERMFKYTGIDFSPVAVNLGSVENYLYGKTFHLDFNVGEPTYLVERGPGELSIDRHLYKIAADEGIEFQFNETVRDCEDFPPDTIIATGFSGELWKKLGLPSLPAFNYQAMGTIEHDHTAKVITYFDEFTRDYAFYSQVNGVRGAVLFARGEPLRQKSKDRFREYLADTHGILFDRWHEMGSYLSPPLTWSYPRLFARNFILTGSLSGSIDPFLSFGVHGALVSGKVAAMTVMDRQKGVEEFRKINRAYNAGLLITKLHRKTPMPLLKRATWSVMKAYPLVAPLMGNRLFATLPGYMKVSNSK
jgi:flavin-dependent dehydrogenase